MNRGLTKARIAPALGELPLFNIHQSCENVSEEGCRAAIAVGLDLTAHESEALQALHFLLWKAYKLKELEAKDYEASFSFTEGEFLEACGMERGAKGDFKGTIAKRYIDALRALAVSRVFPMYYGPEERIVLEAQIVNLRRASHQTRELMGWRTNATAYIATLTPEILRKISGYYVEWNPDLERCMRDGSTRPAKIVPRLAAIIHDCVSGSIEKTAAGLLQQCAVKDCQTNNLRRLKENLGRAHKGGFIELEALGGKGGRFERFRITPNTAKFPSRQSLEKRLAETRFV